MKKGARITSKEKTKRWRLTLFVLIAVFGCVNNPLPVMPLPSSIPNDPMPVYFSKTIKRPFKIIGIATVRAGSYKREESALYKLKKKGRTMGGDAIMDLRQGGPEVFSSDKTRNPGPSSPYHLYSAKVIVFLN